MAKTSQKILEEAQKQLNKNGFPKVTQRTISDSLKISLGNLTYHYKKKIDIIDKLYFGYVAQVDEKFKSINGKLVPANVQALLDDMFDMAFESRYFYVDNLSILRTNPKRMKHYQTTLKSRRKDLKSLVTKLTKEGYLKKESYKGENDDLITRVILVFSSYYSYAAIVGAVTKKNVATHKQTVYRVLEPMLTAKGKKLFASLA